ncbi:RHS repeat protein [Xanthomonas campestris pv. phormiicola]|nr:RHS repeat protein [Xanthomonas campestris pv. phormiicola]UYC15188.1 RHS repeat protein [Xanthomonas campestris pv. phormiicola]
MAIYWSLIEFENNMEKFDTFLRLRAGVVLLAMAFAMLADAQELRFDQKYIERIKQSQDIGRLSVDSFGEQVSLKNGAVEFNWTDIDIPGNSKLPVRLQRSHVIEDEGAGRSGKLGGFGVGGSLDVPYLKGVFSTNGWQVYGSSPNSRCSQPAQPPDYTLTASDYWSGNWMHIPGSGDQAMLDEPASQLPAPSNGTSYPWITKNFWRISCLASTKNGYPGEGFVALSPEGDKYYFDWVVSKAHPDISKRIGNYSAKASMSRLAVFFLATRIEDRFGNWVTYTYNGDQLSRIDASDGRYISVTGTSGANITSVESSVGTWTYAYDDKSLIITQPDNAQSRYVQTGNMEILPSPSLPLYTDTARCPLPEPSSGDFTYAVTLPSNATATYAFSVKRHFRHNIPKQCNSFMDAAGASTTYQYLTIPNFSDTLTLVSKSIAGPDLPSMQWTYTYDIGARPLAYEETCARTDLPNPELTCSKSMQTEVRGPENDFKRYKFGAWYQLNEGVDLGAETGTVTNSGSGDVVTILSTSENEYVATADVAAMPFPNLVGSDNMGNNDDISTSGLRPLKRTTITQQGVSFQSLVNAYDAFARPTSVTRSSTLGNSRTEATAYSDNLGKWVLGQVASVTKTAPGAAEVMSSTNYDAATALPTQISRFGKLIQSIGYNTDGTVASVTDGNSNTTTLGGWKLGLPQNIAYADGTSDSAVVSNRGLIDSVTDENGYTTSYTYDAMGRISGIAYPTGDTVAWAPTTLSFERVDAAEFGIGSGHWRQTIATGNSRKITYFDGLWRPLLVQEQDTANVAATQRFNRYQYDHAGRVLFASYPGTTDQLGTGTWTEYDALGRTTSVSQDSELGLLTTTTQYLSGFLTQTTNPRNQSTITGYMAFDQPSADWPVSLSLPEGAYMDIARDAYGKPLSLTRRNADGSLAVTRSFAYDSYQQLCRSVEPETGATLSAYDGAGNLAWSAAGLDPSTACHASGTAAPIAARKAARTYDARNRIKTLAFPDGNGNTTYTYLPDGLVASMVASDASGNAVTTTYGYNKRRLPSSERLQWGDVDWSAGYGYNANGHLAMQTSPGLSVDYAPNALGQPTQAGTYATGISYYPNGAVKQFTYGNGIAHTMAQNARQLPARSSDVGGGGPLDMAYAYDANANVASVTDYATTRQTRSMTYDGLDRLITAESVMFGGDNIARYSYDVLDNLASVRVHGRDHSYVYDAHNRLSNVTQGAGGSTVIGLAYDVQGNLSNKNGELYQFDYGNRLRSVAGKASYAYDGAGRRVLDYTTGGKRSFYNRDGQLLYADDLRQGKAMAYVYVAGSLVAGISTTTAVLPPPPAPSSAPALSTPSANSTGSYTVSWTSVAASTSYPLEESSNGGTSWSQIYSANDTTKVISGKGSGTYTYRVRACNAGGCSAYSNVGTTVVQLPPASAPSLSAPASNATGSYSVSWNAVASATSYQLDESGNGGSSWSQIYNASGTSTAISGKGNGAYAYRVRACNNSGCSAYSATATTTVALPPSATPNLSAPASSANGSYSVSWSSVATASSYQLEESGNGGSSWSEIYNAGGTSAAISGKGNGSYAYRVRACNGSGCGAYSVTATTTVLLPPSTPSLSVPGSSGTGSYSVSWSGVATASSYQLDESGDGGSNWSQVYNGSGTSAGISGKGNGNYAYRVRACNGSGCSSYSATATTTVLLPPSTPSLSVPSSSNTGSYSVSWSAVATATSYQLEESSNGGSSWSQVYNGGGTSAGISGKGDGSYVYRVRACNGSGCSGTSGTGTVVVALPPPVPTGLKAYYTTPSTSQTRYSASWGASTGATSYMLNGPIVYNGPNRMTASTVSGAPNLSAKFKVCACNNNGCSAWSAEVTAVGQ